MGGSKRIVALKVERAKEIYTQQPGIIAEHVRDLLRKEFGSGLGDDHIANIRRELGIKTIGGRPPKPPTLSLVKDDKAEVLEGVKKALVGAWYAAKQNSNYAKVTFDMRVEHPDITIEKVVVTSSKLKL